MLSLYYYNLPASVFPSVLQNKCYLNVQNIFRRLKQCVFGCLGSDVLLLKVKV